MDSSEFFSMWRRLQGREEDEQLPPCPVAAEFWQKLEDMVFIPLGDNPTRGQIAQAKYMLQEEWHAWKKSIPARHLRNASDHHQCLYDVYDASYDRLHLLELTRRPMVNIILDHEEVYNELTRPKPPAPVPSPPPQPKVPALWIAELDE